MTCMYITYQPGLISIILVYYTTSYFYISPVLLPGGNLSIFGPPHHCIGSQCGLWDFNIIMESQQFACRMLAKWKILRDNCRSPHYLDSGNTSCSWPRRLSAHPRGLLHVIPSTSLQGWWWSPSSFVNLGRVVVIFWNHLNISLL